MKKSLFILMAVLLSLQPAYSQQAIEESKTGDNWYVGVNGGINTKITHNDDIMSSINPSAGIRVGRYWTPVVGWALDGTLYFRDKGYNFSKSSGVRGTNLDLLGTVNLSNWFGGYQGRPRVFEVVVLGGFGWSHIFKSKRRRSDDFVSKFGIDFSYVLDKDYAWQVYVEPAINYNLTQLGRATYNLNTAAIQLSAGIIYKFGNSNGTHNFKIVQQRDQAEIDDLNMFVNELKGEVVAKDKRIAQDIRRINDLMDSLDVAKKAKPTTTVVNKVVQTVVNNNVLQPTIIFGQGKSTVDAAQMASVAMIAKYMKNHPESKILIKGYASPEGNPELNQKLSEARAQSVKDALVKRYGIAESRLTIQGMGATDELFDEVDFNRVATFTDTTK